LPHRRLHVHPRPPRITNLAIVGGGINGGGQSRATRPAAGSRSCCSRRTISAAHTSLGEHEAHPRRPSATSSITNSAWSPKVRSPSARCCFRVAHAHRRAAAVRVCPNEPHLRTGHGMIRAGTVPLRPHRRAERTLPSSFGVDLHGEQVGRRAQGTGFARASSIRTRGSTTRGLVVLNAMGAREELGAEVRNAHPASRGAPSRKTASGAWRSSISAGAGSEVRGNAGARQCGRFRGGSKGGARPGQHGAPPTPGVRPRSKGRPHRRSARVHGEKPRVYPGKTPITGSWFVIPYQGEFLADRNHGCRPSSNSKRPSPHRAMKSNNLCGIRSTRTWRGRSVWGDVVWTYSGVRPLYDDGSVDPSAVTRDYVLKPRSRRTAGGAPAAVDLRRQA